MKNGLMATALVAAGAMIHLSAAAQTPADLGHTLTPTGAIMAGNADGSIPAWTGGLSGAPPGWHQGEQRPDPYASEKPLFSITASNASRYQDKLAAGTMGMLKTLPTFRADVYPTHRTFAAPKFIYDNAIANATRAHLTHDGQDVEGAEVAVPFPIPHTGNEAIWNHILRWRGFGASRTMALAITTPPAIIRCRNGSSVSSCRTTSPAMPMIVAWTACTGPKSWHHRASPA